MAPPRFRISTRQKTDELVKLGQDDLLATGATFTSAIVRVAGYSGISILAIANASFTIRVEEACESDGDFALTQTFTSAADPSGLHFVCERVVPCGVLARIILENTSGAPQTTLSMCTTGLPEGGGGGVGPPGPPGPVGPPGVQTDHAATFVVNPAGGADFTTIAAALAALPAGGGCLFLREGTYSIAATITLPDKPVMIRGCGASSIIDIGSNAIAVFSFTFARSYGFEDFDVRGDAAILTQRVWASTANAPRLDVTRVNSDGTINTIVESTGVNAITPARFNDCTLQVPNVASSRFWVNTLLGGEDVFLTNVDANVVGLGALGGGIVGPPNFSSINSEVGIANGAALDEVSIFGGRFLHGTMTIEGVFSNIIGADFINGTPTRRIDLLVGAASARVQGCTFGNSSSESMRTAASGGAFSGNVNFDVTETGSADNNHYSNNEGFDGSTIIGADSVVDDENTRTVTTTPVTLDRDDWTVLVDSSGGNRLINLPTAASAIYKIYYIKKIAAANTVTIDPSGAETIDGAATLTLTDDDEAVIIQSDGTEWRILSGAATGGEAQIFTGVYTGDGTTSQAITGIGFQPQYVRIWERQIADNAAVVIFESTNTIVDDNAAGGAVQIGATPRFRTNAIISMDSDGFTVDDDGVNDPPNEDGIIYNFEAIG